MPSDIHVFVRFKEPSVFAGEDVECTITFRNVANLQPDTPALDSRPGRHSRRESLVEQVTSTPRVPSAGWNKLDSPRLATANPHSHRSNVSRNHRATASLSMPLSSALPPESPTVPSRGNAFAKPGHKHQRSVSIMSMGSLDVEKEKQVTKAPQRSRPDPSHKRASTVQLYPVQIVESGKERITGLNVPAHLPRRGSGIIHGANSHSSDSGSRRSSPSFTFPAGPLDSMPSTNDPESAVKNSPNKINDRSPTAQISGKLEPLSRIGRTISGLSVDSSARSSGDFHSLSNHSQETLASEQASFMSERPQFPSARIRQHYRLDSTATIRKLETVVLLMGYAQVSATFTLDGSLVDQSPFEEVKRKGFLGGQAGGGVVGVKTPEAKGKFFRGLTLNSIGESIGGLLGGGDLSSLKEMRSITTSRAIPLLSTPQSLLFVDLQLAPGQERSFSFRYTLPQGLPSSHKGKALKVTYNLVIGVQGAPGEKDVQAVRQVNIPFRVFSGVNRDGEVFGHDLMQPYVILRDAAQVEVLDGTSQDNEEVVVQTDVVAESSATDFIAYVDTLLDMNRRRQSSSGTLNPSASLGKSTDSSKARNAISRAIVSSNQVSTDGDRAPNRFEIARNGKHVAVVTMNRASHRLGETITAIIDFSGAHLSCFSVHASLETTEKINPALAMRSATSISRVTRRTYASHSETALFAQRIIFCPFIPVSATPSLMTSGVNLNWTLRIEFATVTQTSHHDSEHVERPSLLEEIVRDERGVIEAAAESARCETFEVALPITVYGDVVTDSLEREEVTGLPI